MKQPPVEVVTSQKSTKDINQVCEKVKFEAILKLGIKSIVIDIRDKDKNDGDSISISNSSEINDGENQS